MTVFVSTFIVLRTIGPLSARCVPLKQLSTGGGGGAFMDYTINNKRKRAEGRNNIKLETTPAIFYYYKNKKRVRIN
jgi:hypothetical protein